MRKKNKVLPYNRDARAFKSEERAQSDSSLNTYDNCPAYFAYSYGLFAHRGKPEKFVWFIYGSALHKVADAIRTEILIDKKVDNRMNKEDEEKYFKKWFYLIKIAMDPEFAYQQKGEAESFIYIPRESINRMGPAKYKETAEKKLQDYLRKAWNTIKAVYYSTRIETTFTYNKYEWRFSSQKFRVPNLHLPDKPIWILGALDEINYMYNGSDLWYIITDLKSGNKNNLKLENNHQMLMYNHVSRNIDHASPSQIYRKEKIGKKEVKVENERLEYLSMFNGLAPKEQFLVSLDVEGWALAKHGDNALYSEDLRLLVDVNYEVEWPEHHKFISDVATEQHYMLKGYDERGNLFPPEFEPLSERGKLHEIGRSLKEQRFIPRIGPRCGLCPAKSFCQEDHPDDWDEYRDRQGIGIKDDDDYFIIDPDSDSVEIEDEMMPLPDEDFIPKYIPIQQTFNFTGRGASKYNMFVPKTVPKRTLKEMKEIGFIPAKSLLAHAKRLVHQLPFLEGGYKCQCMGFKDLIPLPVLLVFIKYAEGKWSLIFDPSKLHNFMVTNCPLEDCLRRKEAIEIREREKEA